MYSQKSAQEGYIKAAFQNVSIQSLYAVLLLYTNYVDMQSNQTMHQL